MDFKERINKLALALGMNKTQLQERLGLSNSYFANVNRVSGRVAMLIRQSYPNVNIEWVNEGHGNMFLDGETKSSNNHLVPLVPIAAMAGPLNDFEAQVNDYDCERIVSPVMDATLAFSISGESMTPEYPNGCKVLVKKINEKSFIEWGRTYLLDTVNGVVVKNIYPCEDDETKVRCHSINPAYPDFNIPLEDVRGWYRVVMQMAAK